ncbi:DMT family transporter [Hartmannibacter diazotrophicus]|uniref:DMT family transporter n=1 Tax=Hartmannibacter diazotrophicus TaxID=1482074 RepID=UPI00138FECFF|nr:DMT family transporter [Hartmannibacter diazotrophicus]
MKPPAAKAVREPALPGAVVPSSLNLPSRDRLVGFGLMLLAMLFFATLDTTAKLVTHDVPTLQVIWLRYAVHTVVMLAIFNPLHHREAFVVRRPGMQVMRALFLTANTSLNFLAVQYLQLTQTVTITFLAPLLIAMLSAFFLKEYVGPRRWAAIAVGFCGVLVVTRPGAGEMNWAILLSLGSVLMYSVYVLFTRHLGQSETAGSMILISAVVPTVLMAPLVPSVWIWPSEPHVLILLFCLGLFGGFGHYLLIEAHRRVAANELAPMTYTQITWMIFYGYAVFGDVPDGWTIAGAAIVILSGLYLLWRENIHRRLQPRT